MKRRWLLLMALPISLICLFLNEIECFVGQCGPGPRNSWFAGWLSLAIGILLLCAVTWLLVLPPTLAVRKKTSPLLTGAIVGGVCAAAFTAFLHYTQGPLTLSEALRHLFLPLLVGWFAFAWLVSAQWPNRSPQNGPAAGGRPLS